MKKPILGPCDSYQLAPFAYPWAWEMYDDCRANEWTPQEIGVSGDVADWKDPTLPDAQRHLFISIMAQLTTFDIERGDDAAESFLRIIQPAEMKQFLKRLIFEEAGHTESYRYCIENMGIPETGPDNIYDTWKRVPAMRRRIEFSQWISDPLLEWSHKKIEAADYSLDDKRAFLRAAFYWFLIFEGLMFWLALLGPVQQLARLGRFRNTAEQFTLIARDEAQHIRFGVSLIREFMNQYPEVFDTDDMIRIIHQDIEEAMLLEEDYIKYCLSEGPVMGYTVPDHMETARYFANMRLRSVGLPELYDNPQHKFPWFAEAMETRKEKNFFETRVTDYQVGGNLSFDDDDDENSDLFKSNWV
jgi:ribonucleoside-diphosphate reductase beta chain